MDLSPSFFEHMTHVVLSHVMGRGYEVKRPHPLAVTRRQQGRGLLSQAKTVRFIASSCPNLRLISVEPDIYRQRFYAWRAHYLDLEDTGSIRQKHVEPLVHALSELVQNCRMLEIVALLPSDARIYSRSGIDHEERIEGDVHFGPITKSLSETLSRGRDPDLSGGMTLRVKGMPWYHREEVVEQWARKRLTDMRKFGWGYYLLHTATPADMPVSTQKPDNEIEENPHVSIHWEEYQ